MKTRAPIRVKWGRSRIAIAARVAGALDEPAGGGAEADAETAATIWARVVLPDRGSCGLGAVAMGGRVFRGRQALESIH
jgi:hypothetical protein